MCTSGSIQSDWDAQVEMIPFSMCKNNKLITNFHFNADLSDPSNPFVHHATDPFWEVLPERVKFPTLFSACLKRLQSYIYLELFEVIAIRPSYLLLMSAYLPFRRPLLLLYLRCKISYLDEWGHCATPFRIVFMPIRTAEALKCS